MPDSPGNILFCSCDDTMPLDPATVRRACRGAQVTTAHQLCRAELAQFRAMAAEGAPLTVGCTQEAALFSEVAADIERTAPITYANIRETAGWSNDSAKAGSKMAALLAVAAQ